MHLFFLFASVGLVAAWTDVQSNDSLASGDDYGVMDMRRRGPTLAVSYKGMEAITIIHSFPPIPEVTVTVTHSTQRVRSTATTATEMKTTTVTVTKTKTRLPEPTETPGSQLPPEARAQLAEVHDLTAKLFAQYQNEQMGDLFKERQTAANTSLALWRANIMELAADYAWAAEWQLVHQKAARQFDRGYEKKDRLRQWSAVTNKLKGRLLRQLEDGRETNVVAQYKGRIDLLHQLFRLAGVRE